MATYKALAVSYVNETIINEGQEFTVSKDVVPGTHWQPVDDEAKAVYAKTFGKSAVPGITDPILTMTEDLQQKPAS